VRGPQFLVSYYTLSLLPGVLSPFLLQPAELFFESFDLSLYLRFLNFPGLPFVLYRQFESVKAGQTLYEGMPHRVAESAPRDSDVPARWLSQHGVRAGAGATVLLSQLIFVSTRSTNDPRG